MFDPAMHAVERASRGRCGLCGYRVEDGRECRVGDTFTNDSNLLRLPYRATYQADGLCRRLPGEGEDYSDLSDALDKLQLNDARFDV